MGNRVRAEGSGASILSDSRFFLLAALLIGAITAVLSALSLVFMENIWMVGDTKLFFNMAGVILNGGTPYVDFMDPKPPLIYFTMAIPLALGEKLPGGLVLVGLCNFASALLVMKMAWKLYGRVPGLLAGVLFAGNMALAEGFFILTEPFTLVFILASAYLLLFTRHDKKYLLSGACAGIAIGFKQYALLSVPLALFFMYRNKELKGAASFLIGAALPLLAIFGALFLVYGAGAGISALYWSFGVADSYFTQGYIGSVPAYRTSDPLVASADILMESALFISLLVLATTGILLDRRLSRHEEFFLVSGIAFLSLLAIRQYLHYWALAIPFIILFCVRPYRERATALRENGSVSPRTPYVVIAALAAVITALGAVEYVFIEGLWRPFDILSYYGLADPASRALSGMLDRAVAVPPLLLSIGLPAPIPWQLIAVCFFVLAGAGMVMLIGARTYGRPAGIVAGVLFTASIVWAEGYLTIADGLALMLVLLSAYFIACDRSSARHFASGLCAGAAACFAPLALAMVPVSMYVVWKGKERGRASAMAAGALIPLALAAASAFTLYGGAAPGMALDSGMALVGVSIAGAPYRTSDAFMAIANIVLAACLFTSLVPAALAALTRRRAPDGLFLLTGLCFLATLLLKGYLHYWFLALPFMALLSASVYRAAPHGKKSAVPGSAGGIIVTYKYDGRHRL